MMTTPSANDIKSAFTFQTFDAIVGEPTYDTLYKLETQATRNAATVTVRLPPPHTNLAGIVEQPAVYVIRVGGPFPRPAYPGDAPVFPIGANLVARTNVTNVFNTNSKNYTTCQTTENLLKTMVENAIEHTYLAGIHSTILGFGARSLQDIFLHLYQSYGRISPSSLKSNTEKLSTPLPPHLPIALIFRQIEDCQRFATAGGTAFTPAQLIKAAETLVLSTGRYPQAYREWLNRPDVEKTFNNFRVQFNREYQIQNEMQHSTAQQQGYAGNVTDDGNVLDNAVANFAEATAADRTAFTNLTDTNNILQDHLEQVSAQNVTLQDQITNMQTQIHHMNMAQQQPPAQSQRSPAPPMYTPPSQAPRMYAPRAPTYMMPPTPPPIQYAPPQSSPMASPRYQPQQYRETRSRGRGRNRYAQGPPQQMCYPVQGQNAMYQRPPSIIKRNNNWNYCFSHGFDVADDHQSHNCQNPVWNHNWQATRSNTMGGSNKNKGKTQLPARQMVPLQGQAMQNRNQFPQQQNPY